ncbi:MAG TPA: hypothetical protein VK338_04490 [Candidatus Nitrosocosmicus sp.]|nr:hypothetical protein [Candidatus Nitrosocosmicus sp.]
MIEDDGAFNPLPKVENAQQILTPDEIRSIQDYFTPKRTALEVRISAMEEEQRTRSQQIPQSRSFFTPIVDIFRESPENNRHKLQALKNELRDVRAAQLEVALGRTHRAEYLLVYYIEQYGHLVNQWFRSQDVVGDKIALDRINAAFEQIKILRIINPQKADELQQKWERLKEANRPWYDIVGFNPWVDPSIERTPESVLDQKMDPEWTPEVKKDFVKRWMKAYHDKHQKK